MRLSISGLCKSKWESNIKPPANFYGCEMSLANLLDMKCHKKRVKTIYLFQDRCRRPIHTFSPNSGMHKSISFYAGNLSPMYKWLKLILEKQDVNSADSTGSEQDLRVGFCEHRSEPSLHRRKLFLVQPNI
jgi:hypothetical protein